MNNQYSIKNFLPLIIIFSTILVATITKQFFTDVWDIHTLMYDFMGLFFIVFGGFKIINLTMFAEAYASYDLIAAKSKLYAHAYPFIELTLGVLYLLHWYPMFTNVTTIIIMLISAAGVAHALYKNEQITCACLGMVFKIPMTYVTLLEDLLMALMAGLMLFIIRV